MYTEDERKVVKKYFTKALKLARKLFMNNEKIAYKKAFKATRKNFNNIYGDSLIKSWINKSDSKDNRSTNTGKPNKYFIINKDVIEALPEFVLTYKGKF